MMHAHSWHITLRPAGWSAVCNCGLAVTVEQHSDGKSTWEWTLHGGEPPADVMLDAMPSVHQAHLELLRQRRGV